MKITLLGAAGKMGSGITLLTAMEMANLSLKPENKSKQFQLNAIDVSPEALSGLMKFLKVQVTKAAEKMTIQLRDVYKEHKALIENRDIIEQYVFDVLNVVRPSTSLESTYSSTLIFEAIKEDPELKEKILSQIDKNNRNKPYRFKKQLDFPKNRCFCSNPIFR